MTAVSNLKTESYKVLGMTCASCAISLESYLKPINGVNSISVNYPNQSVLMEYDVHVVSIESIVKKAKEIGYDLLLNEIVSEDNFQELESKRFQLLKTKLVISAILSFPIFVISMLMTETVPYENWVMMVLSVPALFWCGSAFFINAWNRLKNFSSSMDTLVALSTGIAFFFSVFNTVFPNYFLSRGLMPHVYYESAVVIVTLILLGRFLEGNAKNKTSLAINKLIGLQPKEVAVIRNGREEVLHVDEIIKGDLIVIKPGDRIPVDGVVKKGESFIDESMITGEPIPVGKSQGESVYAGTINQKGTLRILTKKIRKDTLLSHIIQLVVRAQATKPAIQKTVDKIARIFVPVVICLALISFGVWYLIGPEPTFTYALVVLITVLIIACPCALGLATPTALIVGIGKGAEQGILIKDAHSLELIYKVNALILDKTGTITEGKPAVTDLILNDKFKPALLALESASEHPIADAIVSQLVEENVSRLAISEFQSITGLGAKAIICEKIFRVGNQRFMENEKVFIPEHLAETAKELKYQAKTVVYVGRGETVVGIIAISDRVKTSSISAIEMIQEKGIDVYMLTGDNVQTASVVAKEVGIENYYAEVMPDDKGRFVEELQQQGKIVAMVGDGINDAHALAQANVGISMGKGADIAMESSDITLMHSDLRQIAKVIAISRATIATIRQNLFLAFVYNIIAIPIAAGVLFPKFGFLLSPMIAGGAMSLSSVSVLMNSLRLKTKII